MATLELGRTVMTAGVAAEDTNFQALVLMALAQHQQGNWGQLDEEDKALNDAALASGEDRILSAYTIDGKKVWIITEWDRSVTTVLFPDEY